MIAAENLQEIKVFLVIKCLLRQHIIIFCVKNVCHLFPTSVTSFKRGPLFPQKIKCNHVTLARPSDNENRSGLNADRQNQVMNKTCKNPEACSLCTRKGEGDREMQPSETATAFDV